MHNAQAQPLTVDPESIVPLPHPKIDRIACPWLIRRFIDPIAEFTYVPKDQVVAVARPDVTRVPKTPYMCE
jgi:hypothetical protein